MENGKCLRLGKPIRERWACGELQKFERFGAAQRGCRMQNESESAGGGMPRMWGRWMLRGRSESVTLAGEKAALLKRQMGYM